jgi:hypothetical protein
VGGSECIAAKTVLSGYFTKLFAAVRQLFDKTKRSLDLIRLRPGPLLLPLFAATQCVAAKPCHVPESGSAGQARCSAAC